MRVLIADDNDINRQFLRGVLEPEGVEVVEASDGRSAVDRFREAAFDRVLMDIRMPGMDGMEATRSIRALPGFAPQRCRIIALTADLRLRQKEDLLKQGFDACLAKPVDRATLLSALEDESHAAGPEAGDAASAARWIDEEVALRAAGGNRELLERLGTMLDLELARFLPLIAEALANGSLEEARDMVHKIRGSAGYCGARPLQDAAEAMESALAAGDAEAAETARQSLQAVADATREALKAT